MEFLTIAPPPVYVGSLDMIPDVIDHCMESKMLGVDTETIGLVDYNFLDQAVCMTLSPDPESRYYVPRSFMYQFKPLMESQVPKALTFAKFDAHRLANAGIGLGGTWVDTVVLDFYLDEDTRENRHGLKPCAWDYFEIPMRDYNSLFGKDRASDMKPGYPKWEQWLDYSTLDCWASRKLALFLLEELGKIKLWPEEDDVKTSLKTLADIYWEFGDPQLRALYDMERLGVRVDRKALEAINVLLTEKMDAHNKEINRLVGHTINPGSNDQMGKFFFEERGLPHLGLTPTKKYCMDAKVMKKIAFPKGGKIIDETANLVAKEKVSHKKLETLRGTFAGGLLKWIHHDERIHTTYSMTKLTGRLGSVRPSTQNIPRPDTDPYGIRGLFIPDDGMVLIVPDYSQLEIRLLAAASGDATFIQMLNDGLDMHSFVAARMMGIEYEEFIKRKGAGDPACKEMRTAAKSVDFGIAYGITKYKLSSDLTEKLGRFVSEEEAQGYIDMFLDLFPGVGVYMDGMIEQARDEGYVQTICGRFRRLSKCRSKNWKERGHAENQAINAPIQGSAADIVALAMIRLNFHPELRAMNCRLMLQVHDELIFQCPEDKAEEAAAIIKAVMEKPFEEPLPVPLTTEPLIVRNWKDAK
jgi:DNA polymerase I-like protein with 3'-5' exonuclease and polymerase domains